MNGGADDENNLEPCFFYPIPGGLLDRDVIDIKGKFTGERIVIEILTEAEIGRSLPLQFELTSVGVWNLKAYGRSEIPALQNGKASACQHFQVRIIAYHDKYEIYLNSVMLCTQVHKIPLQEVTHLSIDGDAEFTGVEFKDLYSESEDPENSTSYQSEQNEVKPGFIRLSETRQSSNRKPSNPQDIPYRYSFQKKNQNFSDLPQTIIVSKPELEVHTAPPMAMWAAGEGNRSRSSSSSTEGKLRGSFKEAKSKSMNARLSESASMGAVWMEEGKHEMSVDSREVIRNSQTVAVPLAKSEPNLNVKQDKPKKGRLSSLFVRHSKKEKPTKEHKSRTLSSPPTENKDKAKKKHSFSLTKSSTSKVPKETKTKEEKSKKNKLSLSKPSKSKMNAEGAAVMTPGKYQLNAKEDSTKILMPEVTDSKAYSAGSSSSNSSDKKEKLYYGRKGEYDLAKAEHNLNFSPGLVRKNPIADDIHYSSKESINLVSIQAIPNAEIQHAANASINFETEQSNNSKKLKLKGDSADIADELNGTQLSRTGSITSFTKSTVLDIPLQLDGALNVVGRSDLRQSLDSTLINESSHTAVVFSGNPDFDEPNAKPYDSRESSNYTQIKDVSGTELVFAANPDMNQEQKHSNVIPADKKNMKTAKLRGDSSEIADQLTDENEHISTLPSSLTQLEYIVVPLQLTASQGNLPAPIKESSGSTMVYAPNPDVSQKSKNSSENIPNMAFVGDVSHKQDSKKSGKMKGDSAEIAADLHSNIRNSLSNIEDNLFTGQDQNVPLVLVGGLTHSTSPTKRAIPSLLHNRGSYDVNNNLSESYRRSGEFKQTTNDDWDIGPTVVAAPTIAVEQHSAPTDYVLPVPAPVVAGKHLLKGEASEIADNLNTQHGSQMIGQTRNALTNNGEAYPLRLTNEKGGMLPVAPIRQKNTQLVESSNPFLDGVDEVDIKTEKPQLKDDQLNLSQVYDSPEPHFNSQEYDMPVAHVSSQEKPKNSVGLQGPTVLVTSGDKGKRKTKKVSKGISKSEPNLSTRDDPEHLRKRERVANFFRRIFRRKKKSSTSVPAYASVSTLPETQEILNAEYEYENATDSSSSESELSLGPAPKDSSRYANMLFEKSSALDGNAFISTLTNYNYVQYPLSLSGDAVVPSGLNRQSSSEEKEPKEPTAVGLMENGDVVRPRSNSVESAESSSSEKNLWAQMANTGPIPAIPVTDEMPWSPVLVVGKSTSESALYNAPLEDGPSALNMHYGTEEKKSSEFTAAGLMTNGDNVLPRPHSAESTESSSSGKNPWREITKTGPVPEIHVTDEMPWSPVLIAEKSTSEHALYNAPPLQDYHSDDNASMTSSRSSVVSVCGRVIVVGMSSDFTNRLESYDKRLNPPNKSKAKTSTSKHRHSSDSSRSSISSLETERLPPRLKKIKIVKQENGSANYHFLVRDKGLKLDPAYEPKKLSYDDLSKTSSSRNASNIMSNNLY